ncbi:IclR family pca regulon transcriptional regulator [Nocardioides luteus]|uniref:IclR family transcriptional regulator n=1 Tax=Nocardioides luteus TaxID=1844 RepID=A0ABQ5SPR8_9ACTN|nr:IclR family transcriptional regulator C-terminal domain-containing protein [Nocardioides luteus]MDR7313084.1 IclR family pca regulon transcriptional regulator [Nocardioides luteus]GGR44222.1 IclR family transcriptional regulator [Nocardioides luteus]GLJ66145.1 IclR family transcriptional regulator [Nocardioides luteus]
MAEQVMLGDDRVIPDRDVVQSLLRGLDVIRAFDGAHPRLSLDEAAERTGFSRSATRRLLRTLMTAGLASYDGHHYRLTSRLLDLGYASQSRLSLEEVALPHCEELSRQVGRTVSLARLDNDEIVYLLRVGAPRLVAVSLHVGSRIPASLPAIGRVTLAGLSDDELAEFIASDAFREQSRRTGLSADDLVEEVSEIRARGWCHVSEVLEAGLSAVAAPIRDRTGRVVAGLNVSTPTGGQAPVFDLLDTVPHLTRAATHIGDDLHRTHQV